MERIEMAIEGMSCGHCVRAVREALEEVEGVKVEEVAIGSARVAYDPGMTAPDRIAGAVTEAGYAAQVKTAA